ncbi:hypothetical protein J3458_002208 [Metarhizium acridum]|uniref:uncharacterized protein n=1 Tax=Metarhizium acridum TaxID=92637 RepID=UPI001C6AA66B|nr:hypothetical protein J3458_002208 [Metarhizium acridum]
MKVIVAGATGLVGRHLLEQCISSSQITHIYTLSRKQLPNQIGTRAEVTAIRHDDFTSYPAGLLDQISDAEACLWAIGGLVQKFSSVEACKLANVTSTLAAATVFADHVAPHLKQGRKFRFVFCSGMMTEWDQDKRLSFLNDSRQIKGQAERGLFEIQDAHPDHFEVYCPRPSGIHDTGAGTIERLVGKLYSGIGVDEVARAMISIAVNGYGERIISSNALKRIK